MIWDGFLKAAGLMAEVVEEIPKLLSATQSPVPEPPPAKKKRIVKVASGDMVDSPENAKAWNRRVDMGLQSGKKWKRYKRERRARIGLGEITPSSGFRDEPDAQNATPSKADSGTTPGSGGMP